MNKGASNIGVGKLFRNVVELGSRISCPWLGVVPLFYVALRTLVWKGQFRGRSTLSLQREMAPLYAPTP
jgi:hypothetical protein